MKPLHLLLVEDNPDDMLLTRRYLEREFPGCLIQEASDAAALQQAIEQAQFEAVITDYFLGFSNGLEVVRTLRSHFPKIPILMLTLTGSEEIAVEAMKAGLDDYLLKTSTHLSRLGPALRSAVEARAAAAKAAELDLRFHALVNSMQDIVFTLDTQERHTGVYGNWLERTGATAEMFLGKSASEIMDPQAAQIHHEANQKALQGQYVVYEWKQGQHHFQTSLSPMYAEGVLVGLVGVGRDVTPLKTAEQQIELQTTALKASANAIVITNHDGEVVWANPAIEQLTGYTPTELINHNPRIFQSGMQGLEFYQNLWNTVLSGQVWQGELINKRKDGQLYTEEMTITPFNFEGQLSHFIAVKQDVSKRKEAEEQIRRLNQELLAAYDSTIQALSAAIDLRDHETEGHSLRVTQLSLRLGRQLQLHQNELDNLRIGALLHDIGKLGIPDAVLLKPGPLSAEEWVQMKRHPGLAYDWLSQIPFLASALDVPYAHHERWDGGGYPRGLAGTDIPLLARIFAVVDVYDALTSNRPYRKAWSGTAALEYIQQQSGRMFDPYIVDTFVQIMTQHNTAG